MGSSNPKQNTPLFMVVIQRVIACSLHLLMNTCQILLRELLCAVDHEPGLVDEFERILVDDMKLHLDPTKKGPLSECVMASRMQRTHFIWVIENHV